MLYQFQFNIFTELEWFVTTATYLHLSFDYITSWADAGNQTEGRSNTQSVQLQQALLRSFLIEFAAISMERKCDVLAISFAGKKVLSSTLERGPDPLTCFLTQWHRISIYTFCLYMRCQGTAHLHNKTSINTVSPACENERRSSRSAPFFRRDFNTFHFNWNSSDVIFLHGAICNRSFDRSYCWERFPQGPDSFMIEKFSFCFYFFLNWWWKQIWQTFPRSLLSLSICLIFYLLQKIPASVFIFGSSIWTCSHWWARVGESAGPE